MNRTELKQKIKENVYQNAFGEITGDNLQKVLLDMVDFSNKANDENFEKEEIVIVNPQGYYVPSGVKINDIGSNLTAGENIKIEDDTISAIGYKYNEDKNSISIGGGEKTITRTNNDITEEIVVEGKTQAVGKNSFASGFNSIAYGEGSHAEGSGIPSGSIGMSGAIIPNVNFAYGEGSHAEGIGTFAYGDYSHAEGSGDTKIVNFEVNKMTQEIADILNNDPQFSGSLGIENTYYSTDESIMQGSGTIIGYNSSGFTGLFLYNNESQSIGNYIGNPIKSCTTKYNDETMFVFQYSGSIGIDDGQYISWLTSYNIAKGIYSHAEGDYTTASGFASHAEGQSTIAFGDCSHAEGNSGYMNTYEQQEQRYEWDEEGNGYINYVDNYNWNNWEEGTNIINCVNLGIYEFNIGDVLIIEKYDEYNNLIEGPITTKIVNINHGNGQIEIDTYLYFDAQYTQLVLIKYAAIGNYSHREGVNTTASGEVSHAEGASTTASGEKSHAEGNSTKAEGYASHAEGSVTEASGSESHAEGSGTIASGDFSHAEGYDSIASGEHSHAEGCSTEATSYASHAEGSACIAVGWASHAEGSSTTASGQASHSEGSGSIGIGSFSHAEGHCTITNNEAEHAEGKFNKSNTNTISSIGIGTDYDNRKNAQEVMQNGDFYVINIGGYDGTNINEEGVKTLQEVIEDISTSGGGSGGGASYTAGTNINITDNVISAKGYVYNEEINSFAEGQSTTASGWASHAEGVASKAIGDGSHAEGGHNVAEGYASHAEGSGTIASSHASHAEGQSTTASGWASHAEGSETTASGFSSHAEGSGTIASRENSHAEGRSTNASGAHSHAEGYSTTASGDGSHTEGSGTIGIGEASHAEGYSTTASGTNSHAEGRETTASGNFSHAEGSGSIASGKYSHAEGDRTGATGDGAHAEGTYTNASGVYSHAEGSNTTASNYASHSEGLSTKAEGGCSHAEGSETTASGYASHVEGTSGTIGIGEASHAEGQSTRAQGKYSHSEGNYTIAEGDASHAEGSGSIGIGQASHAEGYSTTASGYYSHSEGLYTTASGNSSHAEGGYTTASGYCSHAGGNNSQANGTHSFVHGNNCTVHTSGENAHTIGIDNYVSNSGCIALGRGLTTYRDYCTYLGQYNKQLPGDWNNVIAVVGDGTDSSNTRNIVVIQSGNEPAVHCRGAFKNDATWINDFGEYFEWVDGNPNNEDRVGYMVQLNDDKIELAQSIDEFIGVISATAGFIGGACSLDWHGIYLRDVFGRYITDENGNPIINPEYDENKPYTPREKRPEWDIVGLLGQVVVRQDGTLKVGKYIDCKNGIATYADSGKYKVLKVINNDVALILIK